MRQARGIVAVVPMKPVHRAKSRLAARLTPTQRRTVSLNMLCGVVRAALGSPDCRVWVVGGDSKVERCASRLGAEWREEEGSGLNDTLRLAFEAAFASALAPMYLAADLPFLAPEDVAGAVEASSRGRRLTLSPARRDGGTNAMVVPAGTSFRPALGVGSFQGHLDQAKALGLPVKVCDTPGLGLDLDTLDDLKAYEAMEPGLLARLLNEATLPGSLQH